MKLIAHYNLYTTRDVKEKDMGVIAFDEELMNLIRKYPQLKITMKRRIKETKQNYDPGLKEIKKEIGPTRTSLFNAKQSIIAGMYGNGKLIKKQGV
jgi:hypothetical protein